MSSDNSTDVVSTARDYYNSDDADRFYYQIWGGEDIHIGLYQSESESISAASERTVAHMASKLPAELSPQSKVLDIGAGYGGSARYLARHYPFHLTCLNLSEVQNERNREINEKQGLNTRIDVVDGNFEELPFSDNAFDLVWCQDSILHSGRKRTVFAEVNRVLKSGGHFVFTDIIQVDGVDPNALQPVYDRIHLDSLGSLEAYRSYAAELGWLLIDFEDLSHQLPRHYQRVHDELKDRLPTLDESISKEYVERMLNGLQHWVKAGRDGLILWGIFNFRKTGV